MSFLINSCKSHTWLLSHLAVTLSSSTIMTALIQSVKGVGRKRTKKKLNQGNLRGRHLAFWSENISFQTPRGLAHKGRWICIFCMFYCSFSKQSKMGADQRDAILSSALSQERGRKKSCKSFLVENGATLRASRGGN